MDTSSKNADLSKTGSILIQALKQLVKVAQRLLLDPYTLTLPDLLVERHGRARWILGSDMHRAPSIQPSQDSAEVAEFSPADGPGIFAAKSHKRGVGRTCLAQRVLIEGLAGCCRFCLGRMQIQC